MSKTGGGGGGGAGAEDDDEDECFYESLDRLVTSSTSNSCSTSSPSSSSEPDPDHHPDSPNYAFPVVVPKFPMTLSAGKYDVWISEPASVSERRSRLLREMGLSHDPSLSRVKPGSDFSRSVSYDRLSDNPENQDQDQRQNQNQPSSSGAATTIVRSKSDGAKNTTINDNHHHHHRHQLSVGSPTTSILSIHCSSSSLDTRHVNTCNTRVDTTTTTTTTTEEMKPEEPVVGETKAPEETPAAPVEEEKPVATEEEKPAEVAAAEVANTEVPVEKTEE